MSKSEEQRDAELDKSKDLTPDQIRAGDATDKKMQIRLAQILEEGLEFIRAHERTNDYFAGYTLTEVIQDRIQDIGPDPDTAKLVNGQFVLNPDPLTSSTKNRLATVIRSSSGMTRLEELHYMKERVAAAVEALKRVKVAAEANTAGNRK